MKQFIKKYHSQDYISKFNTKKIPSIKLIYLNLNTFITNNKTLLLCLLWLFKNYVPSKNKVFIKNSNTTLKFKNKYNKINYNNIFNIIINFENFYKKIWYLSKILTKFPLLNHNLFVTSKISIINKKKVDIFLSGLYL